MKSYIVDAFTDTVFGGNPAAVCVREEWLPDALMQKIAVENNLSETAFAVPEKDGYGLRWFTPGGEIDLCGHATLATAFVLAQRYIPQMRTVRFFTRSGELRVERRGELFAMDFPNWEPREVPVTAAMATALGLTPQGAYLHGDLVLLLENEAAVRDARPDFEKLRALPDGLGVILSAKGETADFVSRCFYPKLKVNEDPVTGRAHCSLIPLWAARLHKDEMTARQLSPRGGTLYCKARGARVEIAGKAVFYAESELNDAVLAVQA